MKKKNKIGLAVVIGVIVLLLVYVNLVHYGIFERIRDSQLSNIPTAEEISEKQIMKERLEILKKAAEQDLDVHESVNDELWYAYSVRNFYNYGIVEYIYVSIDEQNYFIEGRDEEVFEVRWKKTEFNPQRTLEYTVKKKDDKFEYEANYVVLLEYRIDYPIPKKELLEEKMKGLFEKARQHYLRAREYFGVDTNEGLEKLLKEKIKVEFK